MSIGLLFWILMVLWFVLGAYSNWPNANAGPHFQMGSNLLLFVLLFLLGWGIFGFVIHS